LGKNGRAFLPGCFVLRNMMKVMLFAATCHPIRIYLILLLQPQETQMSVIIILLIASITVASIFLGAFLYSVKKGQFDDEVSPPVRILFDDTVKNTGSSNPPE
jgi:cbb3-type cytochrome oxidase maturation protein